VLCLSELDGKGGAYHLENNKEAQPYDSLLKALFGKEASEIIQNLLPGAELLGDPRDEEQNIEIDRSMLKADLIFRIRYYGILVILNLELETGADSGMERLLLQYHVQLHAKYNKPVLSVILYPFKCKVQQPPYHEKCGDKVLLTMHHVVICLWELDGQPIVKNRIMCLYVLLPAMKALTADLLKQAIREIIQHYGPREGAEHLMWFHLMLKRTTTMLDEDKRIVEEELDMHSQYKDFLKENPAVYQFIIESKNEGKIEGLREAILRTLSLRFSDSLVELAKQVLGDIQDVEALYQFQDVAVMSDEPGVRASLTQHLPVQ
jgi:hypothetical protein